MIDATLRHQETPQFTTYHDFGNFPLFKHNRHISCLSIPDRFLAYFLLEPFPIVSILFANYSSLALSLSFLTAHSQLKAQDPSPRYGQYQALGTA